MVWILRKKGQIMMLNYSNVVCTILLVVGTFFLFSQPVFSQSAKRMVSHKDWAVFTSTNPKTCWGATAHNNTVSRRNGKVVSITRGNPQLLVNYKKDKSAVGLVTFFLNAAAAPNKALLMRVGSTEFKLYARDSWAWPLAEDDVRIRAAFRKGSQAIITWKSPRGTITEDTFSLSGYTVAANAAATYCGAKPDTVLKQKPVVLAKKVCNSSTPEACSIATLCERATTITGNSKAWSTHSFMQNYVRNAKKRNLACGVEVQTAKPKVTETPKPAPATVPNPDETFKVASGSGFYVSDEGHIITNHHVINGCKDMKVHSKGRVISTLQIAEDKSNDLALLKISETPSHVFALSDNSPFPLQDIIVAGFPFGNRYSSSLKFTQGIVSSLTGMGDNYSEIQIDAALQQGNSGGPLIDEFGNIIAVAVAKLDAKYMFEKYGIIPENTNFGVKASAVKNLMEGNGISVKSPNTEVISKQDLSRLATDGTVYLTCWMTTAQIEKMRTKKVLFEDFD